MGALVKEAAGRHRVEVLQRFIIFFGHFKEKGV
jgi:hypothetical protein